MIAAPIPKDTQEFQFKHASTQRICDNLNYVPAACNLIVADAKRGLLYIAFESKLTVTKYTEDHNDPCTINYDLPYPISKLSISCDYSYLGVTFNKSTAYIYNVNLLSKNSLEVLHEVQLSTSSQDVFGYDLRWNPTVPGVFCTVASDHTIGSFQINAHEKTTVRLVAMEKIAGLDAMCVAWSPKGKQLVVGCANGNIVQLKPELKVARTIPSPSPAIGEVIAILWLSNYQFCAAYSDVNECRINVLIVNAPKGETVANFINYEDITYGMPDMLTEYSPRYYFDHIPEWDLIIAASNSSSEIAVLGSNDNGANWEQWQLIDSARAQLPLIRTTETYPVGITIDKSPTNKLLWGEGTLPNPVPILHIFGTSGQIVSFHMVNLKPNCAVICSPPTQPTTIASPPRMSMLPSEISFNNHPGMTSTPRPKQPETVLEKPKIVPPTSLSNNSSTTANFMSSPSTILSTPAVAAPAIQTISSAPDTHVDLKIPKPRQEKVEVPTVQKTEPTRLSPVKEVSIANLAPENATLDDSICWRAFQEELVHFENELRMKLESQVWQIGTEEEREQLINQCVEIDEFWRELRETTNSLSGEIAYLKALLLQSFAWMEETKSRNLANDNDTSKDRHDRSKIQELQRLAVHTESQLIQAMKALDMQWSEYQLQEKSKMKIPRVEFIYQGLIKHSEIAARHKQIIQQLMLKLKALNKGNKISNLNRLIAKLSLNANSSTALSPGLHVNGDIIEMRCRSIANNMKNFTKEKQLKLRNILLNNSPQLIKPIIPTPIQGRLEATLSSLVTLNPVITPSKQKTEKFVPERPAVTSLSQVFTNTTITTTPKLPASKASNTVPQSPLASLSSIVANIGTPVLESVASTSPSQPQLQQQHQSKTQPITFSMGTFPTMFANSSTASKINTSGTTQFSLKPNTTTQSPAMSQSVSLSLSTQPSTITTAFPKVTTISFGTPDQKTLDSVTTTNLPAKSISTLKPKDTGITVQSTQPFFDTNVYATSISKESSPLKTDQFSTLQNQASSSVGSNVTLSLKDSLAAVTTSQQTVFSFASSPSMTVTPKITTTTTSSTSTESIQTFSFASKPLNPPAFSSDNPERFAQVKSTIDNLDLSKINVGLSANNSAEKLPPATVTSTNSFVTPFSELSKPISSTINFGKASLSTTDSIQSQGNKTPLNLPSGTTIEKVGGFGAALNPTTSGSSIFGGNSTKTSNTFGNLIFGGGSTSLTVSQAGPISSSGGTLPAASLTSMFSSQSTIFSQGSATSTAAPPPPAYNNTQFNSVLTDPIKSLNFGKSPQSSEVSTNTAISTSTPSFFGNNTNTSTNSILDNITDTSAAPPKLFGGNSTSSAITPSIFGGSATTTTSASLFGGSPTFNTQPTMPPTTPAPTFGVQPTMTGVAPAAAFGASPIFSDKPIFGGQPTMFGATKPEFGNLFGSSGFGGPSSFGAAPNIPGGPPTLGNASMGKVFGSPAENNAFESFASQSNQLTFDSLAQKSPSPEKPPSFSGGSSFSSWR